MNTVPPAHLFSLLESLSTKGIETYTHFPEVIRAGENKLEKEDFDYLCSEGLVRERCTDKFGKHFELSERARQLLANKE